MADPLRIAYTVEQCWHDVPGGTAVAALRIADELARRPDDVELHFVAGKHVAPPEAPFVPNGPVAMLPIARPWLYETWTRWNWPKVEAVTGVVDVTHATGLIPAATSVPLVVTMHDIAFVHTPEKFSRHGATIMRRSLRVASRRAAAIVCSSEATRRDCIDHGLRPEQLHVVPLGVDSRRADDTELSAIRRSLRLPDEFVLFVGTLEPRKNLPRLAEAVRSIDLPLVVAGSEGWGDVAVASDVDVRFVGFRSDDELRALYAAATVFAYPSEREGFGLPVLEAMAQGTAVVTSRGTSTEEAAGGAAVLVEPTDVDSIADGITRALADREWLGDLGRAHAATMSWSIAADRTLAVYREVSP